MQAGNADPETLSPGGLVPGQTAVARFFSIVFDPCSLGEALQELSDRGADPSDKEVQTAEMNGQQVPLWTNVALNALCASNYVVYLCEYTDAAKSALDAHKMSGPLGGMGVTGVSKLVGGGAAGLREQWRKAFVPAKMSGGGRMTWSDRPAVQIVEADADTSVSLVLQVQSLDTARDFLPGRGMPGAPPATS